MGSLEWPVWDQYTMILHSASDAELLGLMGVHNSDPGRAREAWEELFKRHRRYLYFVVWRSHGWRLGEEGAADLVVDTFVRAREWAVRQGGVDTVVARFTGATADETRLRVLAWLGAIATRQFQDFCREVSTDKDKFDHFVEEWLRCRESEEPAAEHPLAGAVREALAGLSPADAEALRLSLPWYDAVAGAFMVPPKEAARIATLLGTTTDALRQRRHRAVQRLETHLRASGAALPVKEAST